MDKDEEGFNTFMGSGLRVATCNGKWSRKEEEVL